MSSSARGRSVLISGASIAGPALAYWLSRYGFEVTVVEKAASYRAGGHSVDLRGATLAIAKQMGILEIARSSFVDVQKVTFIGEKGDVEGTIHVTAISGGDAEEDFELPRGDLVGALIAASGDRVEWIFSDSIVGLDEKEDGIEVSFDGGTTRRFDLVIGADGVRSRTRRLGIDPTDSAVKYLGYCFSLFSMPNYLGIEGENVSWNIPGKMAVMLPTADSAEVHGMLAFLAPTPPAELYGDPDKAADFVVDHFQGYGWEIPRMMSELRKSDEVYFDSANWVTSDVLSKGRVGLVGDAGYGPSLFSGQGSGLAMIGAYILAGELARTDDHAQGFAEYERILRPYISAIHATIPRMVLQLAPRTEEDLAARNAIVLNSQLADGAEHAEEGAEHPTPPTITLPDYSDLLVETSRA